jgi:hypothetical protein
MRIRNAMSAHLGLGIGEREHDEVAGQRCLPRQSTFRIIIITLVKFREERSSAAAEAGHKGSAQDLLVDGSSGRGRGVVQRTSYYPDAGHRGGSKVFLACSGPRAHRLRAKSYTPPVAARC